MPLDEAAEAWTTGMDLVVPFDRIRQIQALVEHDEARGVCLDGKQHVAERRQQPAHDFLFCSAGAMPLSDAGFQIQGPERNVRYW